VAYTTFLSQSCYWI